MWETSAQAAEALRPIAGKAAFLLFTFGIVGTGLLAIPVLAGSAAYAVGEAFKWPTGMDRKRACGKGFLHGPHRRYISWTGTEFPRRAEDHASDTHQSIVLGPRSLTESRQSPIMVIVMLMARNEKVMGQNPANQPTFASRRLDRPPL